MRLWSWEVLYRASFVLLLIVFIGLLVVTPIDTILQSQSTGQFWNVIIIVVAYALCVLLAVLLYISRLYKTRKALADIPRRYLPRRDDISKESADLIDKELRRCADIIEQTLPHDQKISHPGLMNPKISEGEFEAPYEKVIHMLTAFIEIKASAIHKSFARPSGMALREYVLMLLEFGLIDSEEAVNEFIEVYEKSRFAGKILSESEFNLYMERCFRLLFLFGQPDDPDGDTSSVIRHGQSNEPSDISQVPSLNNPFLSVTSPSNNPSRTDLSQRTGIPLSRFSTALSPFASRISNASHMTQASRRSSTSNASVIVRPLDEDL